MSTVLERVTDDGESIYYDVSSQELLNNTCLTILCSQVDSGMYQKPRPLNENTAYNHWKRQTEIMETALNGNTESEALEPLRKKLKTAKKYVESLEQSFERAEAMFTRVGQIVDSEDGKAAFEFMVIEERSYEDLNIIELEVCNQPV